MVTTISVSTRGQGLYEITSDVQRVAGESGIAEGICNLLIRHTSASLTIQENADPSAARDLEAWIDRMVPEDDPHYTHTAEGPDDMPAHIKAAITSTTLSIPIVEGRLTLGTWQGIYLWEHRTAPHTRQVVIHVGE